MDVTQNPAIAPSQPAQANGKSANSAISSDFETFLRMLTVQMQNQNPLEPIEASDFAVQLATFSGVEQQVRTNELLTQLMSRSGLTELGSWIGRSVLTKEPVFVDSGEITIAPPEINGADRAELIIRDLDGNTLSRRPIDPFATELVLDNDYSSPNAIPSGYYEITVEGYRGLNSLGEHAALSYARVTEARMDSGEILLVLKGGQMIKSDAVVGLRDN